MSPLLAGAAPPASKCKLVAVAQIPVDLRHLRPLISAAIDGHPADMVVDTGSGISLIYRSAAEAFGLKIVEGSRQGYAAGGVERLGQVTVRDFDVSGFMVHNLILTAAGHRKMSGRESGLLGEDFLSHWDLEFDPAAGIMRLMVPRDCQDSEVVYWSPSYSVVNLISVVSRDADWSRHLKANVQLNGHDVLAVFDTGAPYTIVTAEVAKRPGLSPIVETATGQVGHGLAPGGFAIDTAVFPSITIGQETIQNPKMAVADIFRMNKEVRVGSHIASKTGGEPEMLIGMDFFRAHRVYVARGQKKMYFTYLGGPVFLAAPPPAETPNPAVPK
jgi:predicted aspartyl protease